MQDVCQSVHIAVSAINMATHTHTHTIGSNHIASSQVKIYGFVYVPVIWCHVACVSVVHLREDKIIGLALL